MALRSSRPEEKSVQPFIPPSPLVRLIQAGYLYTRLPNLFDNYQNNYRIGTGVILRLR